MIEKIINNYLANAIIKNFKKSALLRNIDLYVISKKDKVTIYAKDKRFTENYYKEIFDFRKDASIYYLCNLQESNREFNELLKSYQDKEVK